MMRHYSQKRRNQPHQTFRFEHKAATLKQLADQLKFSQIPELMIISTIEWEHNRSETIDRIQAQFQNQQLAIRSSAYGEDSLEQSLAGQYISCLNIDADKKSQLAEAIDRVVESYLCHDSLHRNHPILIQRQITKLKMSGVATTRNQSDGMPYYRFEYDYSGQSDKVTSGFANSYRQYLFRPNMYQHLLSPDLRPVLNALQELEHIIAAVPLMMEFGLDHDDELFLFQVRPLIISPQTEETTDTSVEYSPEKTRSLLKRLKQQLEVCFHHTNQHRQYPPIYGQMPDWNPAELIGAHPRPLALSLFESMVSRDVWRQARYQMGYQMSPERDLLHSFSGRPYVDVKASFYSLIPQGVEPQLSDRLVNAWLSRLHENPKLHDRIEFAVTHSCLDFTSQQDFSDRYGSFFSKTEQAVFLKQLRSLSNRLICSDVTHHHSSLNYALTKVERLDRFNLYGCQQTHRNTNRLLRICRDWGSRPFAFLARHAFIAETLLRSLKRRGAISKARMTEFRQSMDTVSARMIHSQPDHHEETLRHYGHIRPGMFDIRKLPLAQSPSLLGNYRKPVDISSHRFEFNAAEQRQVDQLINEAGFLNINAKQLMFYIKNAIAAREYGKFVFSKTLSCILEQLVIWGEAVELGREELSYLTLNDIYTAWSVEEPNMRLKSIFSARKTKFQQEQSIILPPLIHHPDDIFAPEFFTSTPSFIGHGQITARQTKPENISQLQGRIVTTAAADPGYDWLFTHNIAALVTQYGGPNSHMAVRCAELGIPAVLGCGHALFERVRSAHRLFIDFDSGVLEPIYD